MTRIRATERLAQTLLPCSSVLFLAWYIWTKLTLLPTGIWHKY